MGFLKISQQPSAMSKIKWQNFLFFNPANNKKKKPNSDSLNSLFLWTGNSYLMLNLEPYPEDFNTNNTSVRFYCQCFRLMIWSKQKWHGWLHGTFRIMFQMRFTKKMTWKLHQNWLSQLIPCIRLNSCKWFLFRKDCDPGPPLDASMWAVIEQCSTELVQIRGKFTRIAVLNRGEQIEALHSQFQVRNLMRFYCWEFLSRGILDLSWLDERQSEEDWKTWEEAQDQAGRISGLFLWGSFAHD